LPRAREAFRALREKDERGQIAGGARHNAIRQLDSLRLRATPNRLIAGLPSGPGLDLRALIAGTATVAGAPKWVALGPGNIAGRTRSIIIHPKMPDTIWAAGVGGGIWRTNDAGKNWLPVDDLMANLAISCVAIDPSNRDILYAGTGEGFSNLDAIEGSGIFRTVDGVHWEQIAATAIPDFQWVNRVAISSDGKTVLAATRSGLFLSADPNRQTWRSVLDGNFADVKFDPRDPAKASAGGLDNGEAFYSVDGGLSWKLSQPAQSWSGRVELAYARQNSSIVYVSLQQNGGEIWRSVDSGASYSKRSALNLDGEAARYLGDQGWYGNVIWAGDPTSADFVIVGGIDLWKSVDGGDSLVEISTWSDPRSAHADHHAITAHPNYDGVNNRTVLFGNDGGIYRADDVSMVGNDAGYPKISGWASLDRKYDVTQFYGGAANAGKVIGGAQDNGTLTYVPTAGDQNWTVMSGGDGGWCAVDRADSRYFYGEYIFLDILRSGDGGVTSEEISGQYWNDQSGKWEWKPAPYSIPDAMTQSALFIAPFVLDPNNSQVILAGGISLWRTRNAKTPNTSSAGPSWEQVKEPAGAEISAIAIAPTNSNIVWVGHSDGKIFKSLNGASQNPTWKRLDSQGAKPVAVSRYCTWVTVDPRDEKLVFLCFGGFVAENVWKTADGGTTWQSIGNALPQAPVHCLTVHPTRSGILYVGTEVGLFASENGGSTWSPTNEGPTHCPVYQLFWDGNTLFCATHGRGMFAIDLN